MALAADILSWIFLLAGSFFAVVGGIGVIRMPDVFTRMHASGVTDTMGAGLILTGLMFQGGFTLITAKLILILGFVWFSSPVSTYALARATLASGQEPFWAEDLELPENARIPGWTDEVARPGARGSKPEAGTTEEGGAGWKS